MEVFNVLSTKMNEEIVKLHDDLLEDDNNKKSFKTKIQEFNINAKRDTEEINKLLLATQVI